MAVGSCEGVCNCNQLSMCVLLTHPLPPAGNTVLRAYTFNSNSYSCCLAFSILFQHAPPGVERLLIGNKCDLEERRVVESERGKQLARSLGIPFMETSAKTNHNINEVRGRFVMSL